jgi:hypothetical protein
VPTRAATLPAALCGALLAALLGCRDKGVLGDELAAPACEPACAPDERCERGTCIACGEDCEGPVDAGEDACDGGDDEQCGEGASECEEDNDCDGSGDRECQDGRCVVTDDDEEEEEEE